METQLRQPHTVKQQRSGLSTLQQDLVCRPWRLPTFSPPLDGSVLLLLDWPTCRSLCQQCVTPAHAPTCEHSS
jgi:hypothetical protein